MDGLFTKKNPKDLYAKLCKDLERLRENNKDEDAAIDFFTTAESLTDWVYPGRANKENQKISRNSSVLLQIVSHFASAAKHYKVEAKHHKSISSTKNTGAFYSRGFFGPSFFGAAFFGQGGLVIELDGEAKELLGDTITVIELAEKIVKYWEAQLP